MSKQLQELKRQLRALETENQRLEAASGSGAEPRAGGTAGVAHAPFLQRTPSPPGASSGGSGGDAGVMTDGSPLLAWDAHGTASLMQLEQELGVA